MRVLMVSNGYIKRSMVKAAKAPEMRISVLVFFIDSSAGEHRPC